MKIKMSVGERVFEYINFIVLTLIGLATLLPFLYVIATSITPDKEVLLHGMTLFPRTGFSTEAYEFILTKGSGIPRAYMVTIFVTTVGTALSLIITAMLAYGISKRNLPGRKVITFAVLFTMLFNGGIIPTYMVVKSAGLINSAWSLILPSLISVWNVIVLISFFESIPESIEESARIDGCNDIVIFATIILPLSLPAMATIGLFYAVGYWNQWFNAVMYINDKANWPLQLILRQIILVLDMNSLTDDAVSNPPPGITVKTATIVTTMLPILTVYPFVQKYFVKGIMIGGVKG